VADVGRSQTLHSGARISHVLRTVVVALLLVIFGLASWQAREFQLGARLFPEYVGIAGVALCLVYLLRQAWRGSAVDSAAEVNTADLGLEADDQTAAGYFRALRVFGWIVIYYALIWLIGMMLATALFVPAFLRIGYRARWMASIALAAGLVVLIWVLHQALMLRWPPGVLSLPFWF
jgi:hypothetical protein